MTEFAGQEDRLPRRPSDASDADFIAHRPQFDAWSGLEPAPRRQAEAKRPSRDAIRKDSVQRGRQVSRSAGLDRVEGSLDEAVARLPEADRATFDNGFFMHDQMQAMKSIRGRDSRSLEKSTTLNFGDSSRISRDDMKALRTVARMNEQPIAADAHGEGADAREFAQNVAAYRKQADDRRFGEWKTESRGQREAQASKFSWLSPSTWGMFKNFGWSKKANAKRQIADLEESMGGKAPKTGPWRSGKYRPGATDRNLHTASAYGISPQEFRAWGKAVPFATKYENARTARELDSAKRGLMGAAAAEGVDGADLGKLALGAGVKTQDEKTADDARMRRAIARDPAGDFSYTDGQVVGGHALLGAPTKGEDIPDIVRDVFGMDGSRSAPEPQPSGSQAASDDDDASDPADAPEPGAFQLRRAKRIAQ